MPATQPKKDVHNSWMWKRPKPHSFRARFTSCMAVGALWGSSLSANKTIFYSISTGYIKDFILQSFPGLIPPHSIRYSIVKPMQKINYWYAILHEYLLASSIDEVTSWHWLVHVYIGYATKAPFGWWWSRCIIILFTRIIPGSVGKALEPKKLQRIILATSVCE